MGWFVIAASAFARAKNTSGFIPTPAEVNSEDRGTKGCWVLFAISSISRMIFRGVMPGLYGCCGVCFEVIETWISLFDNCDILSLLQLYLVQMVLHT